MKKISFIMIVCFMCLFISSVVYADELEIGKGNNTINFDAETKTVSKTFTLDKKGTLEFKVKAQVKEWDLHFLPLDLLRQSMRFCCYHHTN